MADFLPTATASPASNIPPATDATNAINALAEVLSTDDAEKTNLRFGSVTSISDPNANGRVQLDIADTAWCSASSELALGVGDRIIAIQQGTVLVVIGRLTGGSATPVGTMVPYAGATAPVGWMLTNGASLVRTEYPVLFAAIGTTYGAADSTHFNLPNVVNRIPVGSGDTYARGATGGSSTVTLSAAQMPSHDHGMGSASASSGGSHSHTGSTISVGDHNHSVNAASSGAVGVVANGATSYAQVNSTTTGGAGGHSHSLSVDSGGAHTHSLSGTTGTAGSGQAHDNMQPYIAVPYIIRVL